MDSQKALMALMLTLFLSLLKVGSGQWRVIGPEKPILISAGKDVVFSCSLSPETSAEAMEVRFFMHEFSVVVHLYKDGEDQYDRQVPKYKGRTKLIKDSIENGHVSLRLEKVTLEDAGLYGCWFGSQSDYQEATWEMKVSELGLPPLVSIMGFDDDGIKLLCTSSGWFPEPTVLWKDPQGHNLLSYSMINQDTRGLFDVHSTLIAPNNAVSVSCSIRLSQNQEVESRILIGETLFQPLPWRLPTIILGVINAFLIIIFIVAFKYLSKNKGKLQKKLNWRKKSQTKEWRDAQKYAVEVTLDPDTAHPQLYIYDQKSVIYKNASQDLPISANRFKSQSVVASQGFQEGKHYWQVDVGNNDCWSLGVFQDGKERSDESLNCGCWVLQCQKNYKYFVTDIITTKRLPLNLLPTRIGILLDYDGGLISFFNVNNQKLIYTLKHQFQGVLRPYIQHQASDEKNVTPIVICTVYSRSEEDSPSHRVPASQDTENLEASIQVNTPFLPSSDAQTPL